MSRTEGTPVDEANMVVSRREQNGVNIQELESEITASGKVTAEDLELLAVLKRADSDKNGVVSAREAMVIFRDDAKVCLPCPRPLHDPSPSLSQRPQCGSYHTLTAPLCMLSCI